MPEHNRTTEHYSKNRNGEFTLFVLVTVVTYSEGIIYHKVSSSSLEPPNINHASSHNMLPYHSPSLATDMFSVGEKRFPLTQILSCSIYY